MHNCIVIKNSKEISFSHFCIWGPSSVCLSWMWCRIQKEESLDLWFPWRPQPSELLVNYNLFSERYWGLLQSNLAYGNCSNDVWIWRIFEYDYWLYHNFRFMSRQAQRLWNHRYEWILGHCRNVICSFLFFYATVVQLLGTYSVDPQHWYSFYHLVLHTWNSCLSGL